MKADILVLTPTLGNRKSLQKTVSIIKTIGGERIMHIIIAPQKEVRNLQVQFPDVEVLAEPEGCKGIYPALNYGFRKYGRDYKYLTFINDDDYWLPGFKKLIETIEHDNPINLLVMGRTETFVGWVAFMDKPLFGHGAWVKDETGKYQSLMIKFKKSNQSVMGIGLIPSHSVLIGAGMQNGILAFIFMGSILILFLKNGIKSLNKNDPYLIIIISFIISIIWIGLFSPVSHFRLTLPLFFAFLLVSKVVNMRKVKLKKKILTKRTLYQ